MARLDDLVAQVPDQRLRREIAAGLADLKRRQRFGLVFEEHIPETAGLFALPIQPGQLVQKRDDAPAKQFYRVHSIIVSDDEAIIEPVDGGQPERAPTPSLLVI